MLQVLYILFFEMNPKFLFMLSSTSKLLELYTLDSNCSSVYFWNDIHLGLIIVQIVGFLPLKDFYLI